MTEQPGDRLLSALPEVYRERDTTGDLTRLLAVFERLFFGDAVKPDGIEHSVRAIPLLFAPSGDETARTPEPFLHWLAGWLSFTPHALFDGDALRRILAGIVPLHGLRGTRAHLVALLSLCFDEARAVHVDDRPQGGFVIGRATLGESTRLSEARPFHFSVAIDLDEPAAAAALRAGQGVSILERRIRAVIDFAKPAHVGYELRLQSASRAPVDEGLQE